MTARTNESTWPVPLQLRQISLSLPTSPRPWQILHVGSTVEKPVHPDARVVLAGAVDKDAGDARRRIEDRLGTSVETVDPRAIATLTDRISAGPELLAALTPLVGVLVREREVAA